MPGHAAELYRQAAINSVGGTRKPRPPRGPFAGPAGSTLIGRLERLFLDVVARRPDEGRSGPEQAPKAPPNGTSRYQAWQPHIPRLTLQVPSPMDVRRHARPCAHMSLAKIRASGPRIRARCPKIEYDYAFYPNAGRILSCPPRRPAKSGQPRAAPCFRAPPFSAGASQCADASMGSGKP